MRNRIWIVLITLLGGCAGYAVQKDGEGKGYDVYAPDPYLLRSPVTSSTAIIGFKFEVVWLPNFQRRYRVHSWAGLGKADFEFTYANGWQLTKVVDQSDNTKVLESLVDLTKHLVPADPTGIAAKRAGDPSTRERVGGANEGLLDASMTPVLYRIEFDEVSGCCVGLKPVGQLPPCGQFPVPPVGSATAPPDANGARAAAPVPVAPAVPGPK